MISGFHCETKIGRLENFTPSSLQVEGGSRSKLKGKYIEERAPNKYLINSLGYIDMIERNNLVKWHLKTT